MPVMTAIRCLMLFPGRPFIIFSASFSIDWKACLSRPSSSLESFWFSGSASCNHPLSRHAPEELHISNVGRAGEVAAEALYAKSSASRGN